MDFMYYRGYRLEDGITTYQLEEEGELYMDIAVFMVENKCTIRQLVKEFLIPRSTVHRYLHKVQKLSSELYTLVRRRLDDNCKRFHHKC